MINPKPGQKVRIVHPGYAADKMTGTIYSVGMLPREDHHIEVDVANGYVNIAVPRRATLERIHPDTMPTTVQTFCTAFERMVETEILAAGHELGTAIDVVRARLAELGVGADRLRSAAAYLRNVAGA